MRDYTERTIYVGEGDSIKFMDENFKLEPTIEVKRVSRNLKGPSSVKATISLYHVPKFNVIIQQLNYYSNNQPWQSITLHGFVKEVSQIERIVLKNINDFN
ncbi:MAG: hypothetical protein PHF86_03450 [Candidatus Nanoarchaeia archaeon]|nr:hypothetical protein [Candidatus Nanoarchaeia archaeon]